MEKEKEHLCAYCFAPIGGFGEVKCKFCGGVNYIKPFGEETENLLQKAAEHKTNREYNRAIRVYDDILQKDPRCTSALWGKLLADYGVEMVADKDDKYVPTMRTVREQSIFENETFVRLEKICQPSEFNTYKDFAERIEKIRQEIKSQVGKKISYDVFICFKKSITQDGVEISTKDFETAKELYYKLTFQRGFKVFFSYEALKTTAGEWEPTVYNALKTAKVMLFVCTNPQYVDKQWIQNEWSRYLDFIDEDKRKEIVPCIGGDMKVAHLPNEIRSRYQALEITEIDFYESLTKRLDNIMAKYESVKTGREVKKVAHENNVKKTVSHGAEKVNRNTAATRPVTASEKSLVNQANQLVQKNNLQALKLYEEALKINPENDGALCGVMQCRCAPRYIDVAGAEALDKILKFAPDSTAREVVYNVIKEVTHTPKELSVIAETLFKYNLPETVITHEQKKDLSYLYYDKAIDAAKKSIVNVVNFKHSEEVNRCIDVALLGVLDDTETYIRRCNTYAAIQSKNGNFDVAKKYYAKTLDNADDGNVNAKIGFFLAERKIKLGEAEFKNFILDCKITDESIISLGIQKSEEFRNAFFSALTELLGTKKVGAAMDMFIATVPYIADDSYYTFIVLNAAFLLANVGDFDRAFALTEIILKHGENTQARLVRVLVETRCRTIKDLILSKKSLYEVQSYIDLMNICGASDNDGDISTYQSLFMRQAELSLDLNVNKTGASLEMIKSRRENFEKFAAGGDDIKILNYDDIYFRKVINGTIRINIPATPKPVGYTTKKANSRSAEFLNYAVPTFAATILLCLLGIIIAGVSTNVTGGYVKDAAVGDKNFAQNVVFSCISFWLYPILGSVAFHEIDNTTFTAFSILFNVLFIIGAVGYMVCVIYVKRGKYTLTPMAKTVNVNIWRALLYSNLVFVVASFFALPKLLAFDGVGFPIILFEIFTILCYAMTTVRAKSLYAD